ncbi:hypothetical protein QYF61_007080, partial [Mycteria americana]
MGWDDAPTEKQNLKPRGGDHKGGTAGHEVKKRVVSGRQLGLPVRKVEAYQWINDNGPYILIPVGPQRQLVKFLIDTGAQISLLTQQDAEKLGIRPRRQRVKITSVNGVSVQCQTAKVNLWLPGEKRMSSTRFAIKDHHENILGFDVLNGRTWRLPNGSVWSFGSNMDPSPARNREAAVRALRAAPAVPESKIANIPQYPISAAARNGISEVIADLEKRQISSRTHSPHNSPVWPVRKPDGRWRLTVDYRRLNANTAPLTAAVPNIANLTATLQAAAHPWMAALDYLIQTSFKYLQGWRLNHFPGQSVPMLDNPLGEEKFPNIQSKPPLAQLEAISSCPMACYLGEETDPHLSTTSFQVVVESNEVSPQPPFLQAKQSQLPQLLLIRLKIKKQAFFITAPDARGIVPPS